jgi:nucleoside-triphosphatase THEP1
MHRLNPGPPGTGKTALCRRLARQLIDPDFTRNGDKTETKRERGEALTYWQQTERGWQKAMATSEAQ